MGPPASAQTISAMPTRMRRLLSMPPRFFFIAIYSFSSECVRGGDTPRGYGMAVAYCSSTGLPIPSRWRGSGQAVDWRGEEGARAGGRAARGKSVDGVAERFGGDELDHLAGGDLNAGAGLRIAAGAGRALADLELADAGQGQFLAVFQGIAGNLRELIKQVADLGLGEVGGFGEVGDQLQLGQGHEGDSGVGKSRV